MLKSIYIIGAVVCLASCSSDKIDINAEQSVDAQIAGNVEKQTGSEAESESLDYLSKVEDIEGVQYSITAMSGLEFIEGKGEVVEASDIDALKKESVIFLEFTNNDPNKKLMEDENFTMQKDDAITYLASGIVADINIEQNEKMIQPNGVLYEKSVSGDHKIRVALFFTDVQMSEEFSFQYYDRLFGAGIVKLINKK